MRKIQHYRLAFVALTLFFNSAQSQPDRFSYAVTAINKGGSEWIALRKLDTRTGEFGSTLLKMTDSSVAAIAYDRKANRIYYVPMNKDQLRYVDLSTMTANGVMGQSFSRAGNYAFQAANPITRLVIAPDDYGYTITNDGNHLIRFTTTGTPILTDLGDLVDDPLNKEMTVHNPCANAGGDMIADDAGNLYLISASNRVFKVNTKTRMATFMATISGLPQPFTTNGAAVDDNGKLIVSGSMYTKGYFIVDPSTWNALPSPANLQIYGSADLANSNVLLTKTPGAAVLVINKSPEKPNKIKVFPDPVLYDEVNIQLNELPPGNYTIQLTNVLGRKILQQKAIITSSTQTEIMYIPSYTAQGFYYIHILNEKNIVVGTQKLAVARRW
jgi:peptidoglycan hydrolase-like protein with peptidoglycan-binding domain